MIRKIQKQVIVWAEYNFGQQESWQMILGIMEEVGELSHAHLKSCQNIRINEDHKEKIKDAIGDIFIYMANYCSLMDIDLQSTIINVWKEVSRRDWKKHPKNGINDIDEIITHELL